MLTINLEFDPNALAAPQSFRDGVQAAANILDAAILDPITVNIEVGYGEFGEGSADYQTLTGGYSLGNSATPIQLSYPALRAALAANETTAANSSEVNALPNGVSLGGRSTFSISSALGKAFGALPGNASPVDGYIGFPASFTGSGLLDTAVVEEAHALGLLNAGGDLGLFSYTSAGNHFLPAGTTSSTPAYFSIDGGNTVLANYNVRSDETLFVDTNNDPLSFPTGSAALTALDLTELGAIGFDVASAHSPARPGITPVAAAPGAKAAVSVHNVGVAKGVSIPVLSFLTSVAAPSGDSIGYYGFYDTGNGAGHLSLNGTAEPAGNWVYVLPTQLSTLQYVGAASPGGSDTINVRAFDATANAFTPIAQLLATTMAIATGPTVYGIEAAADLAAPDGASGATPYYFTVYRTGDASQATTLSYSVTAPGAPPGLIQNPAGTVSLAAGVASTLLTIDAAGLSLASPDRFTVSLAGGNVAIGVASASATIGANVATGVSVPLLDPGVVAINAAAAYGFANVGAPGFTSLVNQDGAADLSLGAFLLTPSFIGGYVAGIEVRVMANLEQFGGGTAQIDAQFGRDMDSISALLAPGNVAEGFGFLAGLTTGGPTGLMGCSVPVSLSTDVRAALGTDQKATGAVAGCVTGAVNFVQGYINNVAAGSGPITALRGVEATAFM